jgi:hypothetical protein
VQRGRTLGLGDRQALIAVAPVAQAVRPPWRSSTYCQRVGGSTGALALSPSMLAIPPVTAGP